MKFKQLAAVGLVTAMVFQRQGVLQRASRQKAALPRRKRRQRTARKRRRAGNLWKSYI